MRFGYVDEAGVGNPAEEPFLVVAGVVIHADHLLNGVKNHLERLMLRHIPPEHQDGFVFTAKHLFNGDNKVFKRGDPEWPLERRLKIADDLAAIPTKFQLPIALAWINWAEFPSTGEMAIGMHTWPQNEKMVAAHVTAFMNCAMMVEQWMRRNTSNENCLLVVENNDRAKKTIGDVQRYYQDKKIIPLLDPKSLEHFPFRKIQEDPLFQPKRPSNPMIVADFCAYVWKKILMKDKRYDRFFNAFRKNIIFFDDWPKVSAQAS